MRLERVPMCRRVRGATLVTTLFFTLITTTLLAGIATYSVSHQVRVKADSDYASALALAEAGINYEIRKLGVSPDTVGQRNSPDTPPNNSGLQGTFSVYCVNQDAGETNWTTASSTLYIYSTGTVGGISRTVKVGASYQGSGASLPSGNNTKPSNAFRLTAMGAVIDASGKRKYLWRILNPNSLAVDFTYRVADGSQPSITGSGTAAAATSADPTVSPGVTYFTTDWYSTCGPMGVYVGGQLASNGIKCPNDNLTTSPISSSGGYYDWDKSWREISPR